MLLPQYCIRDARDFSRHNDLERRKGDGTVFANIRPSTLPTRLETQIVKYTIGPAQIPACFDTGEGARLVNGHAAQPALVPKQKMHAVLRHLL